MKDGAKVTLSSTLFDNVSRSVWILSTYLTSDSILVSAVVAKQIKHFLRICTRIFSQLKCDDIVPKNNVKRMINGDLLHEG